MSEKVTREELAEALGRAYHMRFGLENWSKSAKEEEWAKIALLYHRLDAEQQEKHCHLFTTDPHRTPDCQGDGHYECHNCALLDPDSLMNTGLSRLDAEAEAEHEAQP